ncbi:MAG: anti-sigma factor [Cyanobacteria bacterium P01_D01_bin.156]
MNANNMLSPLSEEEKMLAAGYVLGDLTPEEIATLEKLVVENPNLVREIHSLQASYELMPQALSIVTPPEQLRQKITAALPANALPQKTQPKSTWSILKVLFGLVSVAALGLLADNFRLRYQLAQDVAQDRVASILQQPNSRLISLTGSDSDAAGTLLFTPGNWQEVIVSLGDLPPLPPNEIYRMWLTLENGDIIYCGEFNTDQTGSVFVRFTPPESPPKGVKATELFVTVDGSETSASSPSGERVMEGFI